MRSFIFFWLNAVYTSSPLKSEAEATKYPPLANN